MTEGMRKTKRTTTESPIPDRRTSHVNTAVSATDIGARRDRCASDEEKENARRPMLIV